MVAAELPQGEKEFSDPKLPRQGEASVKSLEKQARSPARSEEMPSAGPHSPVPALHSSSCPPAPQPAHWETAAPGSSRRRQTGSHSGHTQGVRRAPQLAMIKLGIAHPDTVGVPGVPR